MSEPKYRLEGIVHTRNEGMEDFEGPLDVIFLLLSKNKIEIQDVSITAILEQYLAYLEEMIKTKMLLSAAEAAEAESELDQLRQSLVERQRREAMEAIRGAVSFLEPRNEIGRCVFTKDPEPLQRSQSYRYQHEPADLVRSLEAMAERNSRQLPPPVTNFRGIVGKEPYPVTKKTGELLRQLWLRGVEKLKNLFKGNKSRSEIVATFISILDMCKVGTVTLEGDVNGDNPDVRLLDKQKGGEND